MITRILWVNCHPAILGRGFRSVMHDGLVVVWCAIVIVNLCTDFVELFEESLVDVFPNDFDELVSVGSRLHVNESKAGRIISSDC